MDVLGFDAYSPPQIAAKVAEVGVAKARLPALALLMLGIAAGGFIGLGAMYYTLIVSDPLLSFGWARLLGGWAFSLGLILVVVAGAELFTGNNLLVMAWANRQISTRELARNWLIVYVANAIGAVGLAVIVYLARHGELAQGAIGAQYVQIAAAKVSMPLGMLLGADDVDMLALLRNLIPVTLGNIAGGSLMVATVYHLIYNVSLRSSK